MISPRECLPYFEVGHVYGLLMMIGTIVFNYTRPILTVFIMAMLSFAVGYIGWRYIIEPLLTLDPFNERGVKHE